MPSTPRELLEFSSIFCSASTECEIRAAASRAYYAAFHAFLPIALILPATSADALGRRYVSHRELLNRLQRWSPGGKYEQLKKLASSANTAWRVMQASRAERERADYELSDTFTSANAKQQVARAKHLLVIAQQITSEIAKQ
jgi:hypothetical protein